MAPGAISGAVETQFGVHVIRLARRLEGEILPFAAVRARILDYLVARTSHRATAAYLAQVLEETDVAPAETAPETAEQRQLRSFVNAADDERWLQLIGAMNRADDPAAAGMAVIAGGQDGLRPA